MTGAVGAEFKAVDDARKARRRAVDKARREALAVLGCDACGASKTEISGEQARLRGEFYARQQTRNTNEAGTGCHPSGL